MGKRKVARQTPLKLTTLAITYACPFCGPKFTTNLEIISEIKCSLHGEVLTALQQSQDIFPKQKFRLESFSRETETAKKQAENDKSLNL